MYMYDYHFFLSPSSEIALWCSRACNLRPTKKHTGTMDLNFVHEATEQIQTLRREVAHFQGKRTHNHSISLFGHVGIVFNLLLFLHISSLLAPVPLYYCSCIFQPLPPPLSIVKRMKSALYFLYLYIINLLSPTSFLLKKKIFILLRLPSLSFSCLFFFFLNGSRQVTIDDVTSFSKKYLERKIDNNTWRLSERTRKKKQSLLLCQIRRCGCPGWLWGGRGLHDPPSSSSDLSPQWYI